ncbi:MAG: TerD family protein [Candidatus Melainabacteria bacterium]|nr:TerD family protein [Candidatus Melainabacteria bacterium]
MTTAISLTKKVAPGQKISLTKDNPGLSKILIGMGWNPRRTDGKKFDLDAACFLITADGKIREAHDMVSYVEGFQTHPSNAVIYGGDNKDGEGEGDDETLNVDLALMPADIAKIVFTASIYAGRTRQQNFGMVDGAYARLVDATSNTELYKFDLSEEASTNTAVILVRIYRHGTEWKFEGVGQGFDGGFKALCAEYGLEVEEEVDQG